MNSPNVEDTGASPNEEGVPDNDFRSGFAALVIVSAFGI